MSELRVLRYVVAVAEDRSFSRAARRLGVSQPTLSRAVRAFEDEHGMVLFERTTRSVAVTAAGTLVVDRARETLEELDRTLRSARALAAGTADRVRLGFVVSAANALLPGLLRRLREHHPEIDLHLEYMPVEAQVVALRRRRIDVGLLGLPADIATDRLVVEALLQDPHVAALPADHPLAVTGAGPLPLSALSGEDLVFWPRVLAPSLYDEIMLHHHRMTGSVPRIVHAARDVQEMLGLVAAGVGVSMVPRSTATALARTGVSYRPLEDPAVVTLAVAHRAGPGAGVQTVLDACRATAAPTEDPPSD